MLGASRPLIHAWPVVTTRSRSLYWSMRRCRADHIASNFRRASRRPMLASLVRRHGGRWRIVDRMIFPSTGDALGAMRGVAVTAAFGDVEIDGEPLIGERVK